MGRKALFSEEEVFQAADSLAAEGKEVSATALLTALGGGSLTTIYKHLAEWRASRPASTLGAIPLEIPEPVQGAFGAAWRAAVNEAGREIAAVREKANEDIKASQKQFQEALESIARLESEAEADGAKIESLTSEVDELEDTLRKTENERSALAATVEQLQQRVKGLESEASRLRQDLDSERKRHQVELERIRSESDVERKQHAAEVSELKKAMDAAQALSSAEIEKLRKALSESQLAFERVSLERDQSIKRGDKAEKEVVEAKKDRESAVKESAELRGKVEALSAQVSELLSRLAPKQKDKS